MRPETVFGKAISHSGHEDRRERRLRNATSWCRGINPHLFGFSLRVLSILAAHSISWLVVQVEMRLRHGFHEGSESLSCARNRVFRFGRILVVLLLPLLSHTPALADNTLNISDFARVMPLTFSGDGALYELPLPTEVYVWSRRHDLGDLAVFNGQGEIVPFALLAPPAARTPLPGRDLPLFPLNGPARPQRGDIALQVRTDEHGAILKLNTAQGSTSGGHVFGYIADASALEQPVNGLDLVLRPGSHGYLGTLQVEASDDLQQWRFLASGAIATLSAGDRQLGKERIEFPIAKARYFRLSISPEQGVPRIEAVTARLEPPPAIQKREKLNVIITPVKGRDGEYLARISGHVPVDRLRLVFPDENSLAQVTFLSRPDDKSSWIERANGAFYRLHRDTGVLESAPLEIAATMDELWLIRVRQPGGGLGNNLPQLEIGWQPHRLVFAARGEPPFRLAYGSARNGLDSLRDDGLALGLATWERQGIKPLPAQAGASQESGGRLALQPGISAATWKKFLLWSALLMGVLLLARMAWRLAREMRSE